LELCKGLTEKGFGRQKKMKKSKKTLAGEFDREIGQKMG